MTARRAARVDDNHAEIVAALRAAGCSVFSTAGCGRGVPDLVVAVSYGRTLLVEIKNGKNPPSKRRLRECQDRFRAEWTGEAHTVESIDDAMRMIGREP